MAHRPSSASRSTAVGGEHHPLATGAVRRVTGVTDLTTHPDRTDEALDQPGRVDVEIFMEISGFDVKDIGVDVPIGTIVDEAESFGADIIAGFPTETEAMFANSLKLVEDCGLTWLHVFPYSPRKGTPAARMPRRIE